MFRKLCSITMILVAAALITACASPAPGGGVTPGAAPQADEPVTLRVLTSAGSVFTVAFEEMIPQFEDVGINIMMDSFDFVTYEGRQRLAFASGGGEYDLIFVPGNGVRIGAQANALRDVTDIVERIHGDTGVIYDSVRYMQTMDGRWFASPATADTMVLVYRSDLISESEVPTTMEELKALAERVMTDDIYGLAIPGGPGEASSSFFSYFLWSFGGTYLAPNMEPQLNTPEAIAAAEMFATLNQRFAPAGVSTWQNEETISTFLAGHLAMMVIWPMGYVRALDPEASMVYDRVGVAKVPAGPAGAMPRLGGWGLGITESTNHLEAATTVMEMFGSPESFRAMAARQSVATRVINEDPEVIAANPVIPAASAALDFAMERPVLPESPLINTAVGNAVNAIIAGQDAAETMAAVNAEVRAILVEGGHLN